MIGLGIITYNRPHYFKVCLESVLTHLMSVIDELVIVEDGDDPSFGEYFEILEGEDGMGGLHADPRLTCPTAIVTMTSNQGVCKTKNAALKHLYNAGCDYLFLLEDDQEILSPKAVTEYIRWHEKTGCHHFGFAHHGPANAGGFIEIDDNGLEIYPNCVGAYTFFTRKVIDVCGYMDEEFDKNAHEHTEYTARIGKAGLCPAFWRFPDIPNSRDYLREQPGAIHNSSIRQGPQWGAIVKGEQDKFATKHPDVWT